MPLWLILKMAFWIHHLQECYCASDFSGIALMLDENQKKLALFIVHLQTKDDVFSHCNYKQCCKRKTSSKEMHLQTLFISRSPPQLIWGFIYLAETRIKSLLSPKISRATQSLQLFYSCFLLLKVELLCLFLFFLAFKYFLAFNFFPSLTAGKRKIAPLTLGASLILQFLQISKLACF